MPDKLEEFLIAHPLIGVLLMALLGGFLAHLKAMAKSIPPENASPAQRWRLLFECIIALSVRILGAALGGLVVLFTWRGLGWPWEYGFVAAGVVGLFSTEFFEWLMLFGKEWFQTKFSVRVKEPPNGGQ